LDSQKIRQELGWQDQISLAEGLGATLAWVDDHLSTLETLPADYIHKP
jgi:dTDP-glucose 4,6-dehydratase